MRRTVDFLLLCGLTLLGSISLPAGDIRLTAHPEKRAQTIEGFGCSINGWTAPFYALHYDDKFADYVTNELGLSVFRLQMWGGISPDPIENWQDISFEDFRWKGPGLRGKVNVDWARRLVDANPEVRIIGTVWSPPGWMKENNSRTGTQAGFLLNPNRAYDQDNRLRDDRYLHFAKWIVEWARYMESQGTPFYAISLANELMFTQFFESTLYMPEEYARLVRVTGEMFEREGVRKPLFFGPEDMTFANYEDKVRHRPYVDALLEPEVAKYFDVFATHGYTDGVNADSTSSSMAYWESIRQFGRPYWITEGGTGEHQWPAPITDGIAPRLHYALAESNVSLFCGWQLSGEKGKPSHHDFMAWDQPTAKTSVTMHFWKHLRPGTERVETSLEEETDGLLASAYRDDRRGKAIAVIINQGDQDRILTVDWASCDPVTDWRAWQTSATQSHQLMESLSSEGNRVVLSLPALSITTLEGRIIAPGG